MKKNTQKGFFLMAYFLFAAFIFIFPNAVIAATKVDFGDSLSRTTGPSTSAWTITGWVRKHTNGGGYQTMFSLNGSAGSYTNFLFPANNNAIIQGEITSGYFESSALVNVSLDTWYYFAFSFDGSTVKARYINTGGNTIANTITRSEGVISGSYNALYFGSNIFADTFEGEFAGVKIWSGVALSDADIITERQYRNPQTNLGNVWATYHMKSGALGTDSSGNTRTLTENSTPTFVTDPTDILGDDPVVEDEPSGRIVISRPPNNLGLVGYWPFNEGTSTIAGDFSGNNNTGTFSGSPTWVNGKRGKALSFVEETTDGIEIPTTDLPAGNAPYSVSMWVKRDSAMSPTDSNPKIIQWGSAATRQYMGFGINGTTNIIKIDHYDDDYDSVVELEADVWVHLAATYDGTTDRLYKNGVEFASHNPAAALNIVHTDARIGHGLFFGAPEEAWPGLIDEVRIYNRPLSPSEIAALNKTKAVTINASQNNRMTNGLVGLWSFNGGDVDWAKGIVYDRSGINNGIVFNMSTSSTPSLGKVGQSFLFTSGSDYIEIPDNNSFDAATFTISAWIKSNVNTEQSIIDKRGTDLGDGDGFQLRLDNASILKFIITNDAGDESSLSSSNLIPNTWNHVAVTFNESTDTMSMYINGVAQTPGSSTKTPSNGNSSPAIIGDISNFGIGGCCRPTAFDFKGNIDELRFYNRDLIVSEIKQLYLMGQGVKIIP